MSRDPTIRLPWYPLVIGAGLSLLAVFIDQPVVAALSQGGAAHNNVWLVIKLLEPIAALCLLLVFMVTLWRRQRLARALMFLVAAIAVNITLELLRLRIAPDSPGAAALQSLQSGVGWALVLALLSLYANGQRLCAGFLTAVVASTTLTHLLKWLIGRARPHTDLGLFHFNPLHGGQGDFESFPSGHASAAATLALLLSLYFPRARLLFLATAILTGLERIAADKHFPSDVLAGYVLGLTTVYVVVRILGSDYYRLELPAPPLTDATPPSATGSQSSL